MRRIVVLGIVIAVGTAAMAIRSAAQENVAEIEQVKDNLYLITGGGRHSAAWPRGNRRKKPLPR